MPIKAPEPPETIEAVPGLPVLDDIPEPITPPEALAPLPEPTLQQVRDDLRSLARVVDAAMGRLPQALEELLGKLVLGLTPAPGSLSPTEPTLQQMRDDLGCLARVVDAGLNRLPAVFQQHLEALVAQVGQLAQMAQAQSSLTAPEAGALQHLCDTLETLGARGLMITKPYTAEIHARTPSGYTVTLTIERTDGKEFFAALGGMEAWLKQNGHTPHP